MPLGRPSTTYNSHASNPFGTTSTSNFNTFLQQATHVELHHVSITASPGSFPAGMKTLGFFLLDLSCSMAGP
jgi:hypothetical protein